MFKRFFLNKQNVWKEIWILTLILYKLNFLQKFLKCIFREINSFFKRIEIYFLREQFFSEKIFGIDFYYFFILFYFILFLSLGLKVAQLAAYITTYKDTLALNDNDSIVDFPDDDTTNSFRFKAILTIQTGRDGTNNVQILVPLKQLSTFRRTLEMLLLNCNNWYKTWCYSYRCINWR